MNTSYQSPPPAKEGLPTLSVQCNCSLAGIRAAVERYMDHFKEEPYVVLIPQTAIEVLYKYNLEIRAVIPMTVIVPGSHDWWAVGGSKGIVYITGI